MTVSKGQPMEKHVTASTTDTKQQLISVAERLFAERGFAGTTVRNVVSEAGANLGAVHYHFGSKEELFRAVVAQFAHPIVEQELALLKQLQTEHDLPSVEAILAAVLKPCLENLVQDRDSWRIRAQFMGRCRTEPEPLQSIAANEFAVATEAFVDVLQRAIPDQSRAQLYWKFDLVITVLIRVQAEAGQPHALLKINNPKDIQDTTQQLVRFLSAGMRA
ncbi:MAG: TetR/AcrR family transcriptional regulator [Cyanobacteria bacterium P01_D01_bin.56]